MIAEAVVVVPAFILCRVVVVNDSVVAASVSSPVGRSEK